MQAKPKAVSTDGEALDLKLYYYIGSQPSRALLTLLELSGVFFEAISVNMLKGEHKSAAYLKINPNGAVPTLVMNGVVYLESAATLRMLASVLPTLESYYPDDPWQRHTIDAALDFNGTVFRDKITKRSQLLLGGVEKAGPVSAAVQVQIDDGNKEAQDGLRQLEELLT